MSELCKKLKSNTDGHTLHCRADPMLLSADHAIPLGLPGASINAPWSSSHYPAQSAVRYSDLFIRRISRFWEHGRRSQRGYRIQRYIGRGPCSDLSQRG